MRDDRRRSLVRARTEPAKRRSELSLGAFFRLERSGVLLLIAVYCLAHLLVRLSLGPNLTIEEARQTLLAQSFQLGYTAEEPPLAAWLFHALDQTVGLSRTVIFATKYALLAIALGYFYLAARNVLQRRDVSAAAAGAWALTFHAGWEMHEDKLGAVLLFAALSLTLHSATRILTWRRTRDWAAFGAAMGVGALSNHAYVIFPVALLIAIAASPFFRGALTPGRLILSLLIGSAVYAPYAAWLLMQPEVLMEAVRSLLPGLQTTDDYILALQAGATHYLVKGLEFILPFFLFWAMLFWQLWLPILYPIFSRRSTDEEPHDTAWRALFVRATLIAAGLLAVVVLLGANYLRMHTFLPVLIGGPIWLFAHVRRAGDFSIAIRGFATVVIIFTIGVLAGRYIHWRLEADTCPQDGCRMYAPIEAWSEGLSDAGFSVGAIVGADLHLTGNLNLELPRARVLDAGFRADAFPDASTAGACVAVWREVAADDRSVAEATYMPETLAAYLRDELGVDDPPMAPEGALRRPLLAGGRRAATLYFAFMPPSERCR